MRKNKMWKRTLATMLSLCMTFGTIWIPNYESSHIVYANNNETQETETVNCYNTGIENELNSQMAESQSGSYYVSDITIEDKQATVIYRAETACTLIVALYDDAGVKMYTSAKKEILPEQNMVTLEFQENIPENFLVKAFMVDKESHRPLTEAYVDDTYTKEFQEMFSKTAEDFDEDLVMNLDEDIEDNFVVFEEEAIRIMENDTTNICVSAEETKLVIGQPEEKLRQLKAGDEIYYETETSAYFLRVESVKIEGEQITVEGSKAELEEIFSYIKLESTPEDVQMQVNPAEDVVVVTDVAVQSHIMAADGEKVDFSTPKLSFELEKKVEKGNTSASVTGKIAVQVNGYVSIYYSKYNSYAKVECVITPELTGSVSVKGTLEKKIPLGEFVVTFYKIANLEFEPSVLLEFTGEIKTEVEVSGQIGARWDSNNGFKNQSKTPDVSMTIETSGTLFIGISLEPKVTLIDEKVIGVKLTAKLGGEVSGTYRGIEAVDEGTKHNCTDCIDGELKYVGELSAKASMLNDFIKAEKKLIDWEKSAGDFYYSISRKEFGWGTCPHLIYQVDITVLDTESKPLAGYVVYNGTEQLGTTNNNGELEVWLPEAAYDFSVINETGSTYTTKVGVGPGNREVVMIVDWKEAVVQPSKEPSVSETPGETEEPVEGTETPFDPTAHGAVVESGDCGAQGDNVKYELYEDGMLYIYGEGEMADYSLDGYVPWYEEKISIKYVYIDVGLTSIGELAFYGCSRLENVIIVHGLLSIGWGAFRDCNALKEIEIPNSVTSIGGSVFKKCSSLESIEIPDSVTSIWDYAFSGCSSLKSIEIPNSVTSIGLAAFAECTSLESIEIPNSVTSIGISAFNECSSLKSIEIPNSVTSIGLAAFEQVPWLESIRDSNSMVIINGILVDVSIDVGGDIILPSNIISIGAGAFAGCIGLTSIIVSDSVTSIGLAAFEGCTSLESVEIPNSMTSIGSYAFEECSSLKSIEIPNSVTSIGYYAFYRCDNLTIHAPSGSYAETFATENNIPFSPISQEATASIMSDNTDAVTQLQSQTIRTEQPKAYTYKNASQGQEYLFVVVKDENAEDLLATDNVLYIDQCTAKTNGNITFNYFPREETDSCVEKVFEGFVKVEQPIEPDKDAIKGDVNGDNQVTLADAQITLKAALRIIELEEKLLADVNHDNQVTLADAQLVLKVALRITTF